MSGRPRPDGYPTMGFAPLLGRRFEVVDGRCTRDGQTAKWQPDAHLPSVQLKALQTPARDLFRQNSVRLPLCYRSSRFGTASSTGGYLAVRSFMSPETMIRRDTSRETGEVTQLLQQWHEGDDDAPSRLLPLLYDDLRRVARGYSRGERKNHTLQPTAVVHEAWIQLLGPGVQSPEIVWKSREHFLGVAARVMRRVLVDYARQHNRLKRGAQFIKVPLIEADAVADSSDPSGQRALDLHLAIDRSLERLEQISPQDARVVELRFYGGLTLEQTADCLGVSRRTVVRAWRRARAWLHAELEDESWS